MPKGGALVAAENGLGFPSRREEIQRFDGSSKRVIRVASKTVDERSFAEVAVMNSGRSFNQGKQSGMASRLGNRVGPGRYNEE